MQQKPTHYKAIILQLKINLKKLKHMHTQKTDTLTTKGGLKGFKGNQSWVFIGRTDVEAETPILWPPDAKS